MLEFCRLAGGCLELEDKKQVKGEKLDTRKKGAQRSPTGSEVSKNFKQTICYCQMFE